ncbi:serine protease [Synechococcus sp. ATX 2A4]|nr:serine protease [Synechococcus sp. ATX 2A4]
MLLSSCTAVRSNATAPTPKLAAVAPAPTGQSCSNRTQSAEQVFNSAKQGVAVVTHGDGVGSAFVVAHQDGQTFLITNAHVVQGTESVRLKWVDGKRDGARVVARGRGDTPSSDLALLAVQGTKGTPLRIADQASAVGQEVFVIGAPKGLEFSLSRGVVSSLRDSNKILQVDAAINPGNSGGPVLNAGNCVAGVATFKFKDSEGLNFAISAAVVQDFLADLPPASAAADPAPAGPPIAQAPGGEGNTTLCLFKRPDEDAAASIPCQLSRGETAQGQTFYQLAWADGARSAYAFFGDGRVAIDARSADGRRVQDAGSFRLLRDGVAVRSSSDAIAVIPGLDPVLN